MTGPCKDGEVQTSVTRWVVLTGTREKRHIGTWGNVGETEVSVETIDCR